MPETTPKKDNNSTKNNPLIWIDLEMTGLRPEQDVIIEIATIVTDNQLNTIAEGPSLAIHQPNERLINMDEWNTEHHTQSGLLDRVKASKLDMAAAENKTLTFLSQHVKANTSPMCGNSICQDRRFLYQHMPKLEAFFHYRNLDVSTIKELYNRWHPKPKPLKKTNQHLALADIQESIKELKYYQSVFFDL